MSMKFLGALKRWYWDKCIGGLGGFLQGFILFPKSLVHCVSLLVAGALLSPTVAGILPRGQEAAQDRGLDPAIVETLTGGGIDVRVASATSPLQTEFYRYAGTPILSIHILQEIRGKSPHARITPDRCIVDLARLEGADMQSLVARSLRVSRDEIKNVPVGEKEFMDFVFAHELAHCNPVNGAHVSGEADADIRASDYIARVTGDYEITRFTFNWRAGRFTNEEHDMVLIIDAHRRGEALPSMEITKSANRAARAFVRSDGYTQDQPLPENMSALAARRVELYRQARDYFMNDPALQPAPSTDMRGEAVTQARPALGVQNAG